MFNLLHNFIPNPILFSYGFITINWYGIFVVSGIIAGLIVVLKLAKRFGVSADEVYNLGFYVIIFGLIGARIYSVFLDWPYYLANPGQIIAIWNGGLAIHGAIIGGATVALVYLAKKGQSFWHWSDMVAPALPLGQAFGRWGNYFNQEIFGTPTNLPWGIPIEIQNRPAQFLGSEFFHPTFLYESILNLINFFVLLFLLRKFASQWTKGTIFLIYIINYSVIRILMEFLRTDSVPEIFGVRATMVASVVMLIVGLALIFYRSKTQKS